MSTVDSRLQISRSKMRIFQRRFFCSHRQPDVRVRFAPSPTGYLHLGGLRTVVYNFLFARANKGRFILRVEDTDRKRLVPDALENLTSILKWLNLEPDEGPGYGGDFGPYFQSQRLTLYKEHAQKLLDDGYAYRCFCSQDRLMMLRNEALKNRQIVKYDSKCRHLKQSEIDAKLEQNLPYVLRFKIEPIKIQFYDLVHKEYNYNFETAEGDFVLMKSDGYPTYHLANVVDDHFMRISHVLRGDEWLISTPKHLALYEAFKWSTPKFAHLPLMQKTRGKKLSKREHDSFVEYFKNEGYYPQALINTVCSTGKGFEAKEKEKLYSIDELISKFDISLVSRQSTLFEPCWLDFYNKICLNRSDDKFLIDQLKSMIKDKYADKQTNELISDILDDDYVERCLKYAKNRLSTIGDIFETDLASLWTLPDENFTFFRQQAGENLAFWLDNFEIVENFIEKEKISPFDKENVQEKLKLLAQKYNWQHAKVLAMLRAAMCNVKRGVPIGELFELLGREKVLKRFKLIRQLCGKLDEKAMEI